MWKVSLLLSMTVLVVRMFNIKWTIWQPTFNWSVLCYMASIYQTSGMRFLFLVGIRLRGLSLVEWKKTFNAEHERKKGEKRIDRYGKQNLSPFSTCFRKWPEVTTNAQVAQSKRWQHFRTLGQRRRRVNKAKPRWWRVGKVLDTHSFKRFAKWNYLSNHCQTRKYDM